MLGRAKSFGYCGVGLISVRVNVHLRYYPVGGTPGRANVYWASVLMSCRVTVCRVSVHQTTVCRGCLFGEESVGLVPGRASVQIPKILALSMYLDMLIIPFAFARKENVLLLFFRLFNKK